MSFVALRMLMHDRARYLGLVFAIAFASMLMAHQTSIFVSLMLRTTSRSTCSSRRVPVAEPSKEPT